MQSVKSTTNSQMSQGPMVLFLVSTGMVEDPVYENLVRKYVLKQITLKSLYRGGYSDLGTSRILDLFAKQYLFQEISNLFIMGMMIYSWKPY